MNESSVTLEAHGEEFGGRLATPAEDTDRCVLVVPGAGHGPFGDVFDRFTEAAVDQGVAVARFETWRDHDGLRAKTDAEFEAELDAGVAFLRARGCSTVALVAKSFGGRLALTHRPDVDRQVLWAPAILFGEHDDAPSVTAAELARVTAPVRLLQGTDDEVVSVDTARAIDDHLPTSDLVELPGEDHSFRHDEQRVVEETVAFLSE
ncbi:alpha/beta hydrolase [Halomarina rubra]|uniref:Alpha/beta hydrolase n=1 Tax=Halomarina rubra TaxID=2071873 RepID=A0ABD6AV42_9EURY|nr:alpha/beta family hydrolase [Halomarina rubra]